MPSLHRRRLSRGRHHSFTLVEMLVALVTLLLLLAILGVVMENTTKALHVSLAKLDAYATARTAFDLMNAKLAQATLNTYMDYYGTNSVQTTPGLNTNGTGFTPVSYGRASNLQFVVKQNSRPAAAFDVAGASGATGYGQEVYFQCPAAYSTDASLQSVQGLLNACGYYVQYGDNSSFYPSIFAPAAAPVKPPAWRYRLMQAVQSADKLSVITNAISVPENWLWTTSIANTGAAAPPAPDAIPIADNVIALVIWPRLPPGEDPAGTNLAPDYFYDSQMNTTPALSGSTYSQALTADQLPPLLQVTMVVISESSAARIDTKSSTPPVQIEQALAGKFCDVTKYAADLDAMQASLSGSHIEYEVLNTSIVMRDSKWSR